MLKFLPVASLLTLAATVPGFAAGLGPEPAATDYAAPLFDAYFSAAIGYGWSPLDVNGLPISVDNDGTQARIRATFEAPIAQSYGFQGDAVLGRDWNTLTFSIPGASISFDDPRTTATLAAHAFWRDPSVGLIGLIGQYTFDQTEYSDIGFESTLHNYYAGLEGQYFVNNLTLYGQLAYRGSHWGISTVSYDGSGYAVTARARYFVTPDWSVTAKAAYDFQSYDIILADLEQTTWSGGLRSDYRLSSLPISLFGEVTYARNRFEISGGFGGALEQSQTRIMAGFVYSFGSKTLLERDRAGASLDPFETPIQYPLLF